MNPRAWLIAGREFRAYAGTASFWIAMLATPLLLGGALMLSGGGAHPPTAQAASLTLTPARGGGTLVRFSDNFPATAAGRARLLQALADSGAARGPVRQAPPPTAPRAEGASPSRFALVLMLWTTLVGSLGMLLQATVRERANRALESLLAAAHPWDIVAGKLVGVGAVSALVLVAWLGSAAGLAFAGHAAGPVAGLLKGLAAPALLGEAALIYALAFAFYGFTTIAIGASARDNAQAQNLARPMFVTLLAVFFIALASQGGAAARLGWLVYAPPFTPFMLLMRSYGAAEEALALALLAAATAASGLAAVSALRVTRVSAPWSGLLAGLRRA